MMRPLGELPDLVLGPLRGRSDSDWEHGPAGKWTPAQIVEHLALGLTTSAETLLKRRNHAAMSRRRRTPAEHVARVLIFGLRWFPPGRKAPERTGPPPPGARVPTLSGSPPARGPRRAKNGSRSHPPHARHHARQIRGRVGTWG